MSPEDAEPRANRPPDHADDLYIVDSQVHIWRDIVPGKFHRQLSTYWTEDLIPEMKAAGVDAAILCPPRFYIDSVEYEKVVAGRPDLFAGWGFFDPRTPASRELIKTWRRPPYELGLRFTLLLPEEASYWTDGSMDWLWPAAEEYGVPLSFFAEGRLDIIGAQAARHPNLKIIIDHMGRSLEGKAPRAFDELPSLLNLAKNPNVAVKLTGLPCASNEPYPFLDLHDAIKRTVDAYGPERAFWGSDITRQTCTYRECVTMFTEEMSWLKDEDLRSVMGQGLMRWLDWRPARADAP